MNLHQGTRVVHTPTDRFGTVLSAGGGSRDNGVHVIKVTFDDGRSEWVPVRELFEIVS